MSCPLKNAEFKYPNLDKQSFALVKAVKKFSYYILWRKVITIVPDPTIKSLLMENELGEKRGKWMAILQEFNIKIQPMKLVRGQGLMKMMVQIEQGLVCQVYTNEGLVTDVLYQDIFYYLLQNHYPEGLNGSQRRALKNKSSSYMIKNGKLYTCNYNGLYLYCLDWIEVEKVLIEFHDNYGTRHGSAKATTHQILRSGYYWPTLFKDTHEHMCSCHFCQTYAM